MSATTPYRALPAEQRVALIQRVMQANKVTRTLFVQRILDKGRGFRAVTVQKWPTEQLAKEVVRMRAESAQDEFDLLLALYVELDPSVQITFLEAAGVKHEKGVIDEALEPPYTDEAGVQRAVAAVRAAHGEAGEHYLSVLLYYNADVWPGLEAAIAG
ncbi:MAG: hypothetical protein MUE41_12240 [Gemmatimonadaceae bacterium]|jgi:hypothetical protein|nr:hypothetical protein [Gemmatimonadaceae bacterium]